MKFCENLVFLRKEHNLSQEELADKLNVSRQAVSKWEMGATYPEMDKLITLCNLFNTTMDDLVKGTIIKEKQNTKQVYNTFYNKFSKAMAFAVSFIILGLSVMMLLYCFVNENSIIPVTVFLLFVLVSVGLFILNGLEAADFKKLHPAKDNPFSKEDYFKELAPSFNKAIFYGVTLIILGVIVFIIGTNFLKVTEQIWNTKASYYPMVSFFFIFIAVAVYLFIYYGIKREKYGVDYYTQTDYQIDVDKTERYSSVIMISATILYLILGFIFDLWHPGWLVFPIGGMLCGIIGSLFSKTDIQK